MPRTLDEVIQGYQGTREQLLGLTPLPPTATLSTPSMMTPPMSPGMSQVQLVQQAMPAMPPPMATPTMQPPMAMQPMPMATPGVSPAFTNRYDAQTQQQLASVQAYLDPSQAGGALARQSMRRFGERYGGYIGAGVGAVAGTMIPGGGTLGGAMWGQAAGGLLGGIAEKMYDIPVVGDIAQGVYNWMNEERIGDISSMAQIQTGTFGRTMMGTRDIGLGGRGMSRQGALQLGQRYRGQAQQWGQRTGAGEEDVQQYRQDLIRLTTMAGDLGLLESATNIDQIADVTQKLFKVLGKMAKITGDPDFRNNLQDIAQLRQMGFTIDQAVTATRDMEVFARGAGMTRRELMAGPGMMGAQAFQQMGLAPGVGMLYGAQAAVGARATMGAVTPLQASLMGGQQGIQERILGSQAGFGQGPMSLMMGAAMGMEGGQLMLRPGQLRETLAGGTSLASLAGQAQGNLMQVASQMARQQGRPITDVLLELQQRLPEIQSMMMQQLGPQGMEMLQMQTMRALTPTYGMRAAAQMVSQGDPTTANLLIRQASSPEYWDRRMAQLEEERRRLLSTGREEQKRAREAREEARDRERDERIVREMFGVPGREEQRERLHRLYVESGGMFGKADPWETMTYGRAETAREQFEEEAAQTGMRGIFVPPSGQAIRPIAEEIAQRWGRQELGEQVNLTTGAGMETFEFTREGLEFTGDVQELTESQVIAAQRALGTYGTTRAFFRRQAMKLGRGAERQWRGMGARGEVSFTWESQYREALKQTQKSAQAINRTRNWTLDHLADMRKQLKGELERGGVPGAETMAGLRDDLVSYAQMIGREGGTLNLARLRERMAWKLGMSGMNFADAAKAVGDNEEFFNDFATVTIRQFGGPQAARALAETTDIADVAQRFGVEEGQGAVDRLMDKHREFLFEEGVILKKDEVSEQENIALKGFKEASPEVQRAIVALLGTEAGRGEASIELERLSDENLESVKQAQKILGDIEQKGGKPARQTMARLAQMFGRVGYGEELGRGLREMRRGEGRFGAVEIPEVIEGVRIARRAAGLPEEVSEDVEEGTGRAAGRETRTRMEAVEKQIKVVEEMRQAFTGPGSASSELKIAAGKLIEAATRMGASKVKKEHFAEIKQFFGGD